MTRPAHYTDLAICVDEIIARVGKTIVLAVPLGVGKPNPLVNAFFRRAKADPSIRLTILTALTLEKPRGASDLEKRFLEPFVERVFGNYPELDYVTAIRRNELPGNIEVSEFFFKPGGFLNVPLAQQNYISTNYTHVARDMLERGVNVAVQLVAKKTIDGKTYYSLGSNPEVTLDMLDLLGGRQRVLMVGQVSAHMPFMYHDAMLEETRFDVIIDNPVYDFTLFSLPNMPVEWTDYMIGFNASTLIKDGGTLQIGIGALGDAITYACLLRHRHNAVYKELVSSLKLAASCNGIIEKLGGTDPFAQGLYGASEMFVNGFWHLHQAGILKRRVFDNAAIQRLLNEGLIDETVTPDTLTKLLETGAVCTRLSRRDFDFLQRFGIFRQDLVFADGVIQLPDGLRVVADLADQESWRAITRQGLGDRLRGGVVLHAGFFLGPRSLYESLRQLDEATSKAFCMTRISRVNQLYGHEDLALSQRREARFMNTTLMATLTGAAVSDGLEDGQVISGVGGQYNFVAMAHELPGGRSILMLRGTREKDGAVRSNIVWNYGHITIPRHLRDLVVTEYGIADLRGKKDSDIIEALLAVADSRFQDELLEKAKQAGKVDKNYRIPDAFRNNTPQRLEAEVARFKARGFFPDFPFASDFTREEIILGKVLKRLKANLGSIGSLIKSIFRAADTGDVPAGAKPYLARLKLDAPASWKDEIIRKMIVAELVDGGYVAIDKDGRD